MRLLARIEDTYHTLFRGPWRRWHAEWSGGWWIVFAWNKLDRITAEAITRFAAKLPGAEVEDDGTIDVEHSGASTSWSPLAEVGRGNWSAEGTGKPLAAIRSENREAADRMLGQRLDDATQAPQLVDARLHAELDSIEAKLKRNLDRLQVNACRVLRVDPVTHHPKAVRRRAPGFPAVPARSRFRIA